MSVWTPISMSSCPKEPVYELYFGDWNCGSITSEYQMRWVQSQICQDTESFISKYYVTSSDGLKYTFDIDGNTVADDGEVVELYHMSEDLAFEKCQVLFQDMLDAGVDEKYVEEIEEFMKDVEAENVIRPDGTVLRGTLFSTKNID